MGGVNKRDVLITAGQKLIWKNGYDRCSVNDIAKEAKLPKGSFYHYFESKEKFALEAMNEFIESHPEQIPSKEIKVETFAKMIEDRINSIVKINFAKECYMSVMCHSFSEQEEEFRIEITNAINSSNSSMRNVIESLIQSGQISKKLNTDELMEYIDFTWRGARLKARILKSDLPLQLFKKYLINYIFNA